MNPPPVLKAAGTAGVPPNLADYTAARAGFSWEDVRSELEGLPEGEGLNIAHETVDRHARGRLQDHVAILSA